MANEFDALGKRLPNTRPGQPERGQIRVIMGALEQLTTSVVKKVTLDITANLSRAAEEGGTPVDTGWARANWIPAIGSPLQQPAGNPDGGVGIAEAAQQSGIGSVLSYKFGSGAVFITNNVSYILRLNDGSSQQAPAGFVQRAIQEAVLGVRI